MTLFDFDDYKALALHLIEQNTANKRGQFQRISEHLGVHSSLISQVLKGPKDLSLEQACLLADYFGLSEIEEEYFVALVQYQRAGNQALKRLSRKKLDEIKGRSQGLENRLTRQQKLTAADQAVFYSSWHYSGIRLLSEIPG